MSLKAMKGTLMIAAIYNIVWGAWVVLFPSQFFEWLGMEDLTYPTIWQGMGMVIGVYGLAYWLASFDPFRHWPIIAVGFLGKIMGPIGFVWNYLMGKIAFGFFYNLITNDFVWWIPFVLMLKEVHQQYGWRLSDE